MRQLWRELKERGYKGSRSSVHDYLRRRPRKDLPFTFNGAAKRSHGKLGESGHSKVKICSVMRTPSPKKMMWMLLKPDELNDAEQQVVDSLLEQEPEVMLAVELARKFMMMVKKGQADELEPWMTEVNRSRLKELKSFVHGIEQDKAAVKAALMHSWSNGPVEGHINRLKLIKRQMFGRAKPDLLRMRVTRSSIAAN